MVTLAVDTSANLCAACVYDAQFGERGRAVRDLGKGHAEHLMAVIDEALVAAGKRYSDLDRIGVSIGPGSFTGIRVGVSAARGLALALGVPAIGVTNLEALTLETRDKFPERKVMAALEGGRGEIYLALFAPDGGELISPAATDIGMAAAMAGREDVVLTGTAADRVNEAAGGTYAIAGRYATADISVYAKLAAIARDATDRPVPLYLRSADAKVQEGFAVARTRSS